MASADSGIDPRYAPQFQRGFDPARHAAPPVRSGPVRLEGGPPPTAPRVPDPPRMTATPETREAVEPLAPESPEVEPLPLVRRRWDWVVPAFGAALVVIAFMLWWSMATDTGVYYGSGVNDEWAAFVQQIRYTLPGPLLTAGFVAITGGIVLQVVRLRG